MNPTVDILQLNGRKETPYIPQSEASECALACIAMVACFHGYDTDLIALRQRYGMSLKGATLKQVIQVVESIGFNARPLRGELDDLPHLALPAILHWNLNHFVVLTKVRDSLRGTRYRIHDPARGILDYSRDEISRHFTGVALDISKSENFRPKSDRHDLKINQLWSSLSGFWQTILQVLLLSLVMQFVVLATPFFLQTSIDTVFPSFDRDLLMVLAIGFGGLAIINFLASWLRSLILVALSNSLSYQVVVNLFRHTIRLPLDWFEKRHVGDIVSRFGSTQPISQILSQGMIAAFIDGLMAVMTLIMMFIYSGTLGTIAVSALAIYICIRIAFLQSLRLSNLNVITAMAKENTSFIETVRGIAAIKAFGQEGNRQRLWQQKKADAVNANIRLGRLKSGFDAVGQLVIAIERVLFVYVAVALALDAKFSIGMIFAFQAYKQQFLDAGMRLVEEALNYSLINVHLSRVSDIALSKKEEEGGKEGNIEDILFEQVLTVNNVHFRYGIGEPDVLKGVSLSVEPGEMIALVGPSGGGKTTLMKIMMGLFDPVYGAVKLGDTPIHTLNKRHYRSKIGSVAQDDMLYAGSLADNISFFDPDIDVNRVYDVAKIACVYDDIKRMPLAFDTFVGDMGTTLSGGQKQRVLIARALYAQPKILFIDEGTAHLDEELERKILENLNQLSISRVTIAHRSQAIRQANRIIAIADGVAKEINRK